MPRHRSSHPARVATLFHHPLAIAMTLLALWGAAAYAEDGRPADHPTRDQPVEDADDAAAPDSAGDELTVVDGEVISLVADLADEDYEVREAATESLMQLPLTEDQLADAFKDATLPEQVHRLRRVAMHHFYRGLNPHNASLRTGPGGLGVMLDERVSRVLSPERFPQLEHHGILITERIPGFPGFAHLRPGDVIVGIDENYFDASISVNPRDPDSLQSRLQGRQVGEAITLHVMREGREVAVDLSLDSSGRIEAVFNLYRTPGDPGLYREFVRHLRELTPDEGPAVIEISRPE